MRLNLAPHADNLSQFYANMAVGRLKQGVFWGLRNAAGKTRRGEVVETVRNPVLYTTGTGTEPVQRHTTC